MRLATSAASGLSSSSPIQLSNRSPRMYSASADARFAGEELLEQFHNVRTALVQVQIGDEQRGHVEK